MSSFIVYCVIDVCIVIWHLYYAYSEAKKEIFNIGYDNLVSQDRRDDNLR